MFLLFALTVIVSNHLFSALKNQSGVGVVLGSSANPFFDVMTIEQDHQELKTFTSISALAEQENFSASFALPQESTLDLVLRLSASDKIAKELAARVSDPCSETSSQKYVPSGREKMQFIEDPDGETATVILAASSFPVTAGTNPFPVTAGTNPFLASFADPVYTTDSISRVDESAA